MDSNRQPPRRARGAHARPRAAEVPNDHARLLRARPEAASAAARSRRAPTAGGERQTLHTLPALQREASCNTQGGDRRALATARRRNPRALRLVSGLRSNLLGGISLAAHACDAKGTARGYARESVAALAGIATRRVPFRRRFGAARQPRTFIPLAMPGLPARVAPQRCRFGKPPTSSSSDLRRAKLGYSMRSATDSSSARKSRPRRRRPHTAKKSPSRFFKYSMFAALFSGARISI